MFASWYPRYSTDLQQILQIDEWTLSLSLLVEIQSFLNLRCFIAENDLRVSECPSYPIQSSIVSLLSDGRTEECLNLLADPSTSLEGEKILYFSAKWKEFSEQTV